MKQGSCLDGSDIGETPWSGLMSCENQEAKLTYLSVTRRQKGNDLLRSTQFICQLEWWARLRLYHFQTHTPGWVSKMPNQFMRPVRAVFQPINVSLSRTLLRAAPILFP